MRAEAVEDQKAKLEFKRRFVRQADEMTARNGGKGGDSGQILIVKDV